MNDSKKHLTFLEKESEWLFNCDALLVWAQRDDHEKIRCIVSVETLHDHFSGDDPKNPSAKSLKIIKEYLKYAAQNGLYTKSRDNFNGNDLLVCSAEFQKWRDQHQT